MSDATSSSSPTFASPSSVNVGIDDDNDGVALLVEARREADQAESMLRLAEEDAAWWERELADLKREDQIAKAEAAAAAKRASLESVANASRTALDATSDNVEVLMAQVEGLESELWSEPLPKQGTRPRGGGACTTRSCHG